MPVAGSRSKNGWLKSAIRSFGNSWPYLCRIGIFGREWRSRATGSAKFQLFSWQNPLLFTIIKIVTNIKIKKLNLGRRIKDGFHRLGTEVGAVTNREEKPRLGIY
jgi:hypothetical protein